MKKNGINGQLIAVILTTAIIASGLTYAALSQQKHKSPPLITEDTTRNDNNIYSASEIPPVFTDGVKSIYFYSHTQLSDAIGNEITQESLKEDQTWVNLGLKNDYQSLAINAASYEKVPALLTKIENDPSLYLKLIIIDKPSVSKAEYGIGNDNELRGFEQPTNNQHNQRNADTSAVHKSGIYDFEIQIDYYQNNSDIDIEYEVKRDGRIKAEYENEQTGTYTTGKEAENLANKVLEIDFKNGTQDDIIKKLLKILEAPNDYKEIEIDVKYEDGTRITFEHRQ